MNVASEDVLRLRAPAKINLILRVLGQRADGYHELVSWMQKISLYDEITLRFSDLPGITLSCSGITVPTNKGNLLWQAAELFQKRCGFGCYRGLSIHLQKNIPVAAGLGGGSSDAGTLLQGLNNYLKAGLAEGELIELAKKLGADVPFFVSDSSSVLATGIGEQLVPVKPLSNCFFLLVNPGVAVSTKEIFTNFALTIIDKNSMVTGFQTLQPEDLHMSALTNDLEKTSISLYPVIAEIKKDLGVLGADAVLMSGSGPTVFGVFTKKEQHGEDIFEQKMARLRQRYGKQIYLTT